MSYIQSNLVVLEYRFIVLPKEAVKPTPSEGYSIAGPINIGDPGFLLYLEYRTIRGTVSKQVTTL